MSLGLATGTQFNALTDAWLPLAQADGSTLWGSPVEVLSGERDGVDLDYPRDDFRVYARLLLSALVQALFPASTKADLRERLDRPMARAQIEARIKPVLGDFDLFGPTPFLQIRPPAGPRGEAGAASFVFPAEDLFRSAVAVEAISIPLALVVLFAEQTYAGGAGRGYGAGPGGQPGSLTLIDTGSVRVAAWANTLAADLRERKYAPDGPRPWNNETRPARPRAAIGLVEGLFFQPRGIWLIPVGEGQCSFSGVRGPLVKRSPMLPKSSPAKKLAGEDVWQHPCAPLALNSQGIAPCRLKADRPAWTGLAQLLEPLSSGDPKKRHPRQGPALVLQQWKDLPAKKKRPRLLVLDFDRDKASVKRRFFEAFVLTDDLLGNPAAIERLRDLVKHAEGVRLSLVKALTRAHDDRKHGGLALADAESEFWSESEEPFLDWLDRAGAVDAAEVEADQMVSETRGRMERALARKAMQIFDAHVAMSEFGPRQQERVAKARRLLRRALFPRPVIAGLPTRASEVTP